MSLTFTNVSPGIMLFATVDFLLYATFVKCSSSSSPSFTSPRFPNVGWRAPAVLSFAFGAFSIYTIAQEGWKKVWDNHTQNFWGNQVWFDLLFSVGLFWLALAPRAQKLGMPLWPWLLYIVSTASIGGLHFYARILYLEELAAAGDGSSSNVPLNKN